MGNGLANIVAALIIAAAILWTGGFGGKGRNAPTDEEMAAWQARAVGDIKNDIVVNCGCCGQGPRKAAKSF